MDDKTQNPKISLTYAAIVLTLIFIIISSVLYRHQQKNAIAEADKRIEIFNKKWLALFDYIEVQQKEVIYQLEKDGILDKKGFFDPKILSFTYIARQIQKKYEQIEREHGRIPYIYRLAATTPRNSINQATEYEAEILKKFRDNTLERFTEFTYKDGIKFYTSYRPIRRTTLTCMRCHSSPDRAPQGLVERYGTKAGFGESPGAIRGMIIMEIPFNEIEKEAFANFLLTLTIILSVFLGFFIIIVFLIKKDRQLAQANIELEKLSNTDKLTNIPNRRLFDKYISQEWDLIDGVEDTPVFSLILGDIDFFKKYNDTYGHQAGDICLISVAQAISKALKRSSDLVARYGGEEFIVILPNTTNQNAINIVKSIQRNIKELDIKHENSPVSTRVTLSFGISTMVPSKDTSYEELIKKADELLYKAKKEGRNRIASE